MNKMANDSNKRVKCFLDDNKNINYFILWNFNFRLHTRIMDDGHIQITNEELTRTDHWNMTKRAWHMTNDNLNNI